VAGEFIEALRVMQQYGEEDRRRPLEMKIAIFRPGSLGGTPCVGVETVAGGFDWDAGKLMIYPSEPLTALSPEEVADIRKSVAGGQSWHAYQQHKEQQDKIKAAEQARDKAQELLARFVAHFDEHQRLSDEPNENAAVQNDLQWFALVEDARTALNLLVKK